MRAILLLVPTLVAEVVSIPSTLDGERQKALVELPADTSRPAPLLVHLHSWSASFDSSSKMEEAAAEARRRGWAFVSPDFRGPNDKPAACGSELAVQDVLDAVHYVQGRARIDERRIYLLGGSGGGYMALVMAGRAPHVWAAASAWVPITDLAAWHEFSKSQQSRYWKMLEGCFGSEPYGAAQQYRRRSPVFFLSAARGLPIDINTGIQDGHTGSVPIDHSLRAFNALAAASERIAAADIKVMTREAKVPKRLRSRITEDRMHPVLLRRGSGTVRLTIFDGGHETDFPTAIRWLERHTRPAWTLDLSLRDHQVLQRDASGHAALPVAAEPGLEVRVNNGAWTRTLPMLATGGPYRIELRRNGATAVRQGIRVGDLYILAGQSNMVGRAPLEGAAGPDPSVLVFTPQDTWEMAREPLHEARRRPDGVEVGAGLGLSFGKAVAGRDRIAVGLIPCAVGGTSLEQWSPNDERTQFRRSLYGNCIARAHLAGGRFRGLLWYQGEADAARPETARTYQERFVRLMEAFRRDLHQPALPVYFAQLSRHVAAMDAEGWTLVREVQRRTESALPHSAVVATIDATLTDPIHLDRESLERLGQRFAVRVSSGPGPSLASAAWDKPGRLRLKFTHRLRAAGGRIHGFSATGGFVYHAAFDGGDIVLSISAGEGKEPVRLYYGRGLDPVCNLTDERDLALPAFGPLEVQ
jgi:poly(3-hydroxybutyrate) depolymerase